MVGKARRINEKQTKKQQLLDESPVCHIQKPPVRFYTAALASVEQHKVPLAMREDAGHPFRMYHNVELYYITVPYYIFTSKKSLLCHYCTYFDAKTPSSSNKTTSIAASTLVSLAAPWLSQFSSLVFFCGVLTATYSRHCIYHN